MAPKFRRSLFLAVAGVGAFGVFAFAILDSRAFGPSTSDPTTAHALETPPLETPERQANAAPASGTVHSDTKDPDFVEVLRRYQALNRRLESIADPILLASADLCVNTVRDPGYTVHTVRDYPEDLQSVARVLLPVSDTVSLRTVRAGSQADLAGLVPGDQITAMNGHRLATGITAKRMYALIAKKAMNQPKTTLSVRRGTENLTVTLAPERICDSPVNVFFSDVVNGHADGAEIWITSGLMFEEQNDTMLALIVAHELAHNIDDAKQKTRANGKAVELRADRMALVILRRAGYNLEDVLNDWDRKDHAYALGQDDSDSHPTFEERQDNFKKARARINAQEAAGLQPDFE